MHPCYLDCSAEDGLPTVQAQGNKSQQTAAEAVRDLETILPVVGVDADPVCQALAAEYSIYSNVSQRKSLELKKVSEQPLWGDGSKQSAESKRGELAATKAALHQCSVRLRPLIARLAKQYNVEGQAVSTFNTQAKLAFLSVAQSMRTAARLRVQQAKDAMQLDTDFAAELEQMQKVRGEAPQLVQQYSRVDNELSAVKDHIARLARQLHGRIGERRRQLQEASPS